MEASQVVDPVQRYIQDIGNPSISVDQALGALTGTAQTQSVLPAVNTGYADLLLGGVSTIAGQGAAKAAGLAGSGGLLGYIPGISALLVGGMGIALALFGAYAILRPSQEFVIRQAM
jgi:hypothetical protein